MAMPRAGIESVATVSIAILAKAPVAGLAKTRLIPHLGAEAAAALQGWLLQRAVDTALQAGLGPVTLWCAPDCSHPVFSALQTDTGICLQAQPEGDLGLRMQTAAMESPTPATLIIGTDCPVLTPETLRNAAAALLENEVVLTPAEDGGYVLIGLRKSCATDSRIFENIEWSSARVMAQTRQGLQSAQRRWHEMATLWDVDTAADFERLAAIHPSLRALVQPTGATA